MTIQKIYIHLIDGTDVWLLLNAKLVRDTRFEIPESVKYNESNSNELFEFFPGDVVELEERVFPMGLKGKSQPNLSQKDNGLIENSANSNIRLLLKK